MQGTAAAVEASGHAGRGGGGGNMKCVFAEPLLGLYRSHSSRRVLLLCLFATP